MRQILYPERSVAPVSLRPARNRVASLPGSPVVDVPHYDKCVLLMPMFGADGGTDFTDYSPVPKIITRYGDVKTATDSASQYGSSTAFDGDGDYLSIPPPANISGDFTISIRFRSSQTRQYACLLSAETGVTGWTILLNADSASDGKINIWVNASLRFKTTSGFADGIEHHLEWSRAGSSERLFIDGEVVASRTSSDAIVSSSVFYVGRSGITTARDFRGNMNDLIVVSGVALHTENFTPPTRPLIRR